MKSNANNSRMSSTWRWAVKIYKGKEAASCRWRKYSAAFKQRWNLCKTKSDCYIWSWHLLCTNSIVICWKTEAGLATVLSNTSHFIATLITHQCRWVCWRWELKCTALKIAIKRNTISRKQLEIAVDVTSGVGNAAARWTVAKNAIGVVWNCHANIQWCLAFRHCRLPET